MSPPNFASPQSWPAPRPGEPGPAGPERSGPITRSPTFAAVAVAVGWVIIGFELFVVNVFVGREQSCSGNRGDAYRSCVRQEDITELVAEAVAIGLSLAALVVLLGSVRRGDVDRAAPMTRLVFGAAVALAIVCIVVWIHGSQGGWAPSRPAPFDPISTSWGHITMTIGVVSGVLVGALVVFVRRRRGRSITPPR